LCTLSLPGALPIWVSVRWSIRQLAVGERARPVDEQGLDFVVSVELLDALDAARDLGHVPRAMRVAARRVVQALLENELGRTLGHAAVFSRQRGGIEQRGGSGVDEALERVERFPRAPIAFRVRDDGQDAAPSELGEAAVDHRWEIDLVELEQRRTPAGIGQRGVREQPLVD